MLIFFGALSLICMLLTLFMLSIFIIGSSLRMDEYREILEVMDGE